MENPLEKHCKRNENSFYSKGQILCIKNSPPVENFFYVAKLHQKKDFSTRKSHIKLALENKSQQRNTGKRKKRENTKPFSTEFQGFSKKQN